MKDFGEIEIHGKKIHVTADDDVDNLEVVSSVMGMKLAEIFDIDIKIKESKE